MCGRARRLVARADDAVCRAPTRCSSSRLASRTHRQHAGRSVVDPRSPKTIGHSRASTRSGTANAYAPTQPEAVCSLAREDVGRSFVKWIDGCASCQANEQNARGWVGCVRVACPILSTPGVTNCLRRNAGSTTDRPACCRWRSASPRAEMTTAVGARHTRSSGLATERRARTAHRGAGSLRRRRTARVVHPEYAWSCQPSESSYRDDHRGAFHAGVWCRASISLNDESSAGLVVSSSSAPVRAKYAPLLIRQRPG